LAAIKSYDRITEVARREAQKVFYSDFPKTFSVHPEKHDLSRVVNENAIIEALKNLIMTDKGERFFNLDFGCDIKRVLFEDVSPTTLNILHSVIATAIKNYEPRVNIISMQLDATPDENGVQVFLEFSVANRTTPIRTEFLLTRVR
jgi:phage baseplate assembly protein W